MMNNYQWAAGTVAADPGTAEAHSGVLAGRVSRCRLGCTDRAGSPGKSAKTTGVPIKCDGLRCFGAINSCLRLVGWLVSYTDLI